jgi:hypothetical protein
MKKRQLIYIGIVLLLGLLGWILLRDDKPPKQSERKSTKVERSSRRSKSKAPEPISNSVRRTIVNDEGVVKPEGMSDEDWQRSVRVYSAKKLANRIINFYGKVVDQNEDPVQGVELTCTILAYQTSFSDYLKTGNERVKRRLQLITDKDGAFIIENMKGTSLDIESMLKNGYVRANRGANYSFVYNNLSSGERSSIYHYPEQVSPVVYTMWKKGETEPLIKTAVWLDVEPANGVNEIYYPFVLKGKPHSKPMKGWDVKVTGINRGARDWEYTLTANNGGGFILASDLHANIAPEEGYRNSLVFKSSDQKNPLAKPVKNIYYRSEGGDKYASFRIEASWGGKNSQGGFTIKLLNLRINPNGSRNLEYDESKRIK